MKDTVSEFDLRRERTRLQYLQNADVLDGWEWVASKSYRTCLPCLLMDGKRFDLETPMPSVCRCVSEMCRCTLIGVIKNLPITPRTIGIDWYRNLPMEDRENIIGSHGFVTDEQIARLDAIFDKRLPIETDEDLLRLAELVEDESDE